jgi:hypothetical protein
MAYHVTSTPLVYPPPPGIRLQFKYQQGPPYIWRTPANDPVQYGSGYLILANQPGIQITRVKYIDIVESCASSTSTLSNPGTPPPEASS